MLFEQGWAVDLMLIAGASDFVWMQGFSKIVNRRSEQNGATVEGETRERCVQSVEKLDSDGVDER